MKDTTNVSIRGDRAYTMALKALAYGRGVAVCDITRESVDAKFGSELQPLIDRFRAQLGDKSIQSDTDVNKAVSHG